MVTVGHVVGYVLAAAFVVVFVWLVRRVWRGQMDWIDGAGWATAAMLVAASSLLPWYVAWLLPFAALCERPAAVADGAGDHLSSCRACSCSVTFRTACSLPGL